MRDQLQTSGARARLRSTAATGRPFFPTPRARLAVFDGEIADIENGTHQRLHAGLADIHRRQVEQIESAETYRSQRIVNIENEFDCAVKAAIDQYHEEVLMLRNRLTDEVKRNRRRYMDTNRISSPPSTFRKKARPATATRSTAAMQNQRKPAPANSRLSDDEIRHDMKRMSKPFTPRSSSTHSQPDLIRVLDAALYVGAIVFHVGDHVQCGRLDEIKWGKVVDITDTEVVVADPMTNSRQALLLVYLRTGRASIMHSTSERPTLPDNDEPGGSQDSMNGLDRMVVACSDAIPLPGIPEQSASSSDRDHLAIRTDNDALTATPTHDDPGLQPPISIVSDTRPKLCPISPVADEAGTSSSFSLGDGGKSELIPAPAAVHDDAMLQCAVAAQSQAPTIIADLQQSDEPQLA